MSVEENIYITGRCMLNCEYAKCFELAFDNFQLWAAMNIVKKLLKQLKEQSDWALLIFIVYSKKVNQSRYRPGVAQRVPGS